MAILPTIRVLLLNRYGPLGASSRLRTLQYIPFLKNEGIEVTPAPLLEDAYVESLYAGKRWALHKSVASYFRRVKTLLFSKRFDVVWLEGEAMPWMPYALERLFLSTKIPYVVDYDDAVFHRYDMHESKVVRSALGTKIDSIMRRSDCVVVGNSYLEARAAESGARRIEIVPTVVDLTRYPQPKPKCEGRTIGWIGSPSTQHNLEIVSAPLQRLTKLGATLRLIGLRNAPFALEAECIPWSENSEVEMLSGINVGIMPLIDRPFEHGKCGYKLIQYMASGKPVVCTPIGVNTEIVTSGVNGYFASTDSEWGDQLNCLLTDSKTAIQLGLEGRRRVEEQYCVQKTAPKIASVLRAASGK